MYWKFIIVNLLLVLPNSRILTSGRVETLQDYAGGNDGSKQVSDVQLLDHIVNSLVNYEKKEEQAAFLDKKADQGVDQNIDQNADNKIIQSLDPNNTGKTDTIQTETQKEEKVLPPEPPGNVFAAAGQALPLQQQQHGDDIRGSRVIEDDDKQFIIIVAVAVCTGFVGLMLAGVCYYKFRKSAKAVSDVEYPAYGVTGPVKDRIPSPGDRKLAQSAQMYHYQHQKQQMIAMEKANGDMKHDASDDDSEEDNIEGDYTVYECPGLAPTGEMEVRNPLFRGDDTPVTPGEDITGQPHGHDPSPERGHQ